MFSDHLQKFSRFPQTGLLMAAGGLVIVCQLAAMAMVADEQVQSAGVRDLQRVAQQVALADCIQRSTGPNRHICIRQTQIEPSGYEFAVPDPSIERDFSINNVAIARELARTETADVMRGAATR
jgi:hypothetical protein